MYIQKAHIPLPKHVRKLNAVFRRSGYKLYLVGGAIRDFLMGLPPKDYDVASAVLPQEVGRILTAAGIYNYPKGEAFGVWVAHIDGEDYEIATFREDLGVSDGRHPDAVKWTTPEGDAKRRDLTMNALFYEIPEASDEEGAILDFFDGQAIEDVETRTVRVVGDPVERFKEDRLRILRLVRFHCRFSDTELSPATLDERTLNAIYYFGDLLSPLEVSPGSVLSPVSKERIQAEFESGFVKCKDVKAYILSYYNLNLLGSVFPELDWDINGVDRLRLAKDNIVVAIAYFLRKNGAKASQQLNKMTWPNKVTDEVAFLLKAMDAAVDNKPEEMIVHAAAMEKQERRRADAILFGQLNSCESIESAWTHFTRYKPALYSGQEIMQRFGIEKPGPEIGIKQRELQAERYRQSLLGMV